MSPASAGVHERSREAHNGMRDLTIQIHGVEFRNKGAELMLLAVLQNLRPVAGQARFVLRHSRAKNRAQREALGLQKLCWKQGSRVPLSVPLYNGFHTLTPRRIRRRRGWVCIDEVDVVLDASGFAYGDQFGSRKVEVAADYFEVLKRHGTRIILLPQQLGPFENPNTRAQFIRILQLADLVFARDRLSYQFAVELGVGTDKIRLAPDFTVTLPPRVPASTAEGLRRVCIVPNRQMVEKTNPEVAQQYRSFLARCARYFLARGFDLSLLIHEDSDHDYHLAVQVTKDVQASIPIIREPDPLLVKGILGRCHVTVGSRFHGLVNALSQGVPSLGTGWSHKYRMLFEDFGCTENLVSPGDPESEIISRLDAMTDGPDRAIMIASLRMAREQYLTNIQQMWSSVNELLADSRRPP